MELWKYAVRRNNQLHWHIGLAGAASLLILLANAIGWTLPGLSPDITHTAFIWPFLAQVVYEAAERIILSNHIESDYAVDPGDSSTPHQRWWFDTLGDTIGAALGSIAVINLWSLALWLF